MANNAAPRHLDYDFIACLIMREFGWTIEYTLNLTFPQFIDLLGLVKRCRMDAAFDEFYVPYTAVKYGGDASKHLFKFKGDYYLHETVAEPTYTPEMLDAATKRLKERIERNRKKIEESVS